jgi:hypothetical protein
MEQLAVIRFFTLTAELQSLYGSGALASPKVNM